MSFDKLRTNGRLLIPFVVMLSLSKHRTMSGIHLFRVSNPVNTASRSHHESESPFG